DAEGATLGVDGSSPPVVEVAAGGLVVPESAVVDGQRAVHRTDGAAQAGTAIAGRECQVGAECAVADSEGTARGIDGPAPGGVTRVACGPVACESAIRDGHIAALVQDAAALVSTSAANRQTGKGDFSAEDLKDAIGL